MILIMGATGNIGRQLVSLLQHNRQDFKALVRSNARGRKILGNNIALAIADYRDETAMKNALADVDKLFLVTDQVPDQLAVQSNIIDWARESGVNYVVKISAGKALTHQHSHASACRAHWQADQYLAASTMNYSVIHPQAFMDTTIETSLKQIKNGKLITPFKGLKFSFVAAADIAKLASALLIDSDNRATSYIASGPKAISWQELADTLERHIDRPIKLVKVPLWLAKLVLRLSVKPRWLARHKAQMLRELCKPNVGDLNSDDILQTTGDEPMSFDKFITENIRKIHGDK